MPITLSQYRIYAGRKQVDVVTETLDGARSGLLTQALRVTLLTPWLTH
jgi:hypothetical protein